MRVCVITGGYSPVDVVDVSTPEQMASMCKDWADLLVDSDDDLSGNHDEAAAANTEYMAAMLEQNGEYQIGDNHFELVEVK